MALRNIYQVAEHLIAELGERASAEADLRQATNATDGDDEAAEFWNLVGRAIRALGTYAARASRPG